MTATKSVPRITVILNPVAGRGRGKNRRAALEALLADATCAANITWQILETQAAGDASRLARQIASTTTAENEIIVAAGGDGTLSEVLNGVAAEGFRATIGVLPLGTGNDFARCLGFGTNLEAAANALFERTTRVLDVGLVRFDASGQERYFLNIAGCGFDALVAQRVNALRHRRGWRHVRGTPAYLCAVVQELAKLRAARLHLQADGQTCEQEALLCAVANASSYGGGMRVAPNAELDDGLFDLCTIGDARRLEFLRAFPGVFKGTHVSHPKVTMRRAREVYLSSRPPLPILVDGDVLGTTPAHFSLLPRAVRIVTPH